MKIREIDKEVIKAHKIPSALLFDFFSFIFSYKIYLKINGGYKMQIILIF